MKKITLKNNSTRELETREAFCDFCKEAKKPCVSSSILIDGIKTTSEWVVDDYSVKVPLFGKTYCKVYECPDLRPVVKSITPTERKIDICNDCIKQLAKLIK